jgi:hypothetical protein
MSGWKNISAQAITATIRARENKQTAYFSGKGGNRCYRELLVTFSRFIRVCGLSAIALLPSLAGAGRAGNGADTPAPRKAYMDPKAAKLLAAAPATPDAPPPVHLANISTRLVVGTGDNVLIAGFTITGSQPKKVMLRALGPFLPVVENLADPTLELHDSFGGTTAVNDNWRDTQQDEVKGSTIPPASDYESSIIQTLTPGAYTAVVAGKGATTGVGVVEVYDLDLTVDSKLANISTRGRVDQGDNVLIAGTIVLGNGTTTVLFRALGPSLSSLIPNALQDPTLELHDGQGGIVASNDNWQDSQKDAIEQTTIAPGNLKESAILQSLSPGNYTAVVRGKNNTTGVAVVDAYQLN